MPAALPAHFSIRRGGEAEAEKRLSGDSTLSTVGIHYKSDPAAINTLIGHVFRSVAPFLRFGPRMDHKELPPHQSHYCGGCLTALSSRAV
jgi:hypothetical protein